MLDRFPVQVVLPGGRKVGPARVVGHDGRLRVYVARSKTVRLAFDSPLTVPVDENRRVTARTTAQTDAGTVTWTRGGGCGCGNPLKAARPDILLAVTDPY